MPKRTWGQAAGELRSHEALAVLVSGQNPDGTPYVLPVELFGAALSNTVALGDHETGIDVEVSPFGALRVAEMTRLIGGTFGSSIGAQDWAITTANGGTASAASSVATLDTAATAAGRSMIVSTRRARFLSGNANEAVVTVRLPDAGAAGNTRRWGLFDATDGLFWELSGTDLGVVSRKGGVDTRVPNAQLNGPRPPVLDTNSHAYQVAYMANKAYFYQDRHLAHALDMGPALAVGTLHLPIGFETVNGPGVSGSRRLEIRSASVLRFGQVSGEMQYFHVDNVINQTVILKTSPGTLGQVIVNKKGNVGSGSGVRIYDAITADPARLIADIDTTATQGPLTYGVHFDRGLTYATGASNPGDLTISYD